MIALAANNNPEAVFQLMDGRYISKLGKQYDGVMCGFGLPYLSKEEAVQLINDAATLLNPGAVFYISTMEDEYDKSGFQTSSAGDSIYVYYHQADYLVDAIEKSGLAIIELQRKEYPADNGTKTTDLLIIAGR